MHASKSFGLISPPCVLTLFRSQVRRLPRPNLRVRGRRWPGRVSSESSSSRSFIGGGSRSPPGPFSSYCWLSICCKVGHIRFLLHMFIYSLNSSNKTYSCKILLYLNPYKELLSCIWSADFLKIHLASVEYSQVTPTDLHTLPAQTLKRLLKRVFHHLHHDALFNPDENRLFSLLFLQSSTIPAHLLYTLQQNTHTHTHTIID